MLASDDVKEIINASIYISDNKDTGLVTYMLKDGMDPRISHDFRHYGKTVYQIKMIAMRKLTGVEFPRKLNYKPDSAIFKFYFKLAQQRGWVNDGRE